MTTAGCGKPYTRVTLQSMEKLNLNNRGESLSVVVRIYQLKNKERLERADFLSLWQDEASVLGEDLVERNEITLYPETDKVLEVSRKEEAIFLGVAAFFRKPSGNSWRQIIPLVKKRQKTYIILEEETITLSKKKMKRKKRR